MAEVLTLAEIENRYKSEWVLIVEPDTDDTLQVKGGSVASHSTDRDEVYRKAVELRPKRFAVLYTGQMPDDTVIVL